MRHLLYVAFIIKVDYILFLLNGVLYRLPCTALFSLDTAKDQIGSVNHFTVTDLDRRLGMCLRCCIGNFHIAVIVVIGFLVIQILGSRLRQHKNEGAVVIPILLSDSKNGGGCELIKISISADEKVYVFVFRKQSADFFFQPIFYPERIVNISVSKERHRVNVHTHLLTKIPTEPFCVRWVILMTRLSLKNSPVELQRPYSAKDGDIPSRKADAQNCYVYSGHLEPCSITFAYYKHGFYAYRYS